MLVLQSQPGAQGPAQGVLPGETEGPWDILTHPKSLTYAAIVPLTPTMKLLETSREIFPGVPSCDESDNL